MNIRLKYSLALLLFFCFSCSTEKTEEKTQHNEERAPVEDTQHPFADKMVGKTEEEVTRYDNGVIKMQGFYLKGKREGVWRSWYSNGKPWSEGYYKQGVKEGKATTWYENGQKRYEGEYKNDRPSGEWKFWDETGQLVKTEKYH